MKAHINYPRCGRCGYQYTPKRKERRRMFYLNRPGGKYVACQDCIAEYMEFLQDEHTKEEEDAFLETFKIEEEPALQEKRFKIVSDILKKEANS